MTDRVDNRGPPLAGAAMRLGGVLGTARRRLERGALAAGGRLADRVALPLLDAVLTSRAAEQAVDRALASSLAHRAVRLALERPLLDVLADERTVERMLEGPELERAARTVLESPAVDRLVRETLDSRLVDRAVAHLLEGDELWLLVEEVARSPAVAEAVQHQGAGFADQVTDGMRARSRDADAWLERAARRALRRPGS